MCYVHNQWYDILSATLYVTGIEMDSHTEMASQSKTWASWLSSLFYIQ